MRGMTPATETELMADLTENNLKIAEAVAVRSGPLSDAEWQANLNQIIALRLLERELETKLAAVRK